MDLISLAVTLLILGIIVWLVIWIVGMIPMPEPFKIAIYVIMALIAILYLLGMLPHHPILLH